MLSETKSMYVCNKIVSEIFLTLLLLIVNVRNWKET